MQPITQQIPFISYWPDCHDDDDSKSMIHETDKRVCPWPRLIHVHPLQSFIDGDRRLRLSLCEAWGCLNS